MFIIIVMVWVRDVFVLVVFLLIMLVGCADDTGLVKDEDKVFGVWLFDKIVYSNYTLDVGYVSNTVFVFENKVAFVSNNITNYYGRIERLSEVITNFWSVDFRVNKIYLTVGDTNFSYSIALVAVDSREVNHIWLMDGSYVVSGVTNSFFVSNRIKMYVLKKV